MRFGPRVCFGGVKQVREGEMESCCGHPLDRLIGDIYRAAPRRGSIHHARLYPSSILVILLLKSDFSILD